MSQDGISASILRAWEITKQQRAAMERLGEVRISDMDSLLNNETEPVSMRLYAVHMVYTRFAAMARALADEAERIATETLEASLEAGPKDNAGLSEDK